MQETVNLQAFRELVKKSIGPRSQAEFAKDCGLTASHMNRILSEKNQSIPQVKTIRNIAKVAVNGVTLNQLLISAGYEPQEDNKCVYSDDGNFIISGITEQDMSNYDIRKDFREKLIELRTFVRPFDNFDDVFSGIVWDCDGMVSNIHYTLGNEQEIKEVTGWHHGADYCVYGRLKCEKDNSLIEFDFALFYCKTDKGKLIICDTDWGMEKEVPVTNAKDITSDLNLMGIGAEDIEKLIQHGDGGNSIYLTNDISELLMKTIADIMVNQGKWTVEEAEDYLLHGSEEV